MFRMTGARLALVIAAVGTLGSTAMADSSSMAAAGKKLFVRCAACHSLSAQAPAMFGPHLEEIVGRRAGTIDGFDYTDARLRDQTFIWDEAYFDEWLETPQDQYPEMCLPFRGLADPDARKALFTYLKQPLP